MRLFLRETLVTSLTANSHKSQIEQEHNFQTFFRSNFFHLNFKKLMTEASKQKYRLGLDLGTNSIGWAMLALNQENQPYKIIDAGVRIFSDGRNPKDGTPLAVARREARGMRRRRDRFLARKSKLMNCLVRVGLMPKDEVERKKLELLNPYELRAKALDEALNPFGLGRAIFHLNQRRGFKSNRKEIGGDEKEKSKTKDSQTALENKIKETNSRTLGEFFYKQRILKELTTRAKSDESGLYPTRAMYENEFGAIKESQISRQKITEANWQELKEIIFHQRPLAPQEKGVCQFVTLDNGPLPIWAEEALSKYLNSDEKCKKAKGLPRAALALPSYMKFRILSEVNNLRIIDSTRAEILLDVPQKRKIIEQLHKKKSSAFTALRKLIGFGQDAFEFNLEGAKRDKLQGNETEILLSGSEYFGEKWPISLRDQDEIVEFLLEENDEERIYQKAISDWGLEEANAQKIKKITPSDFKSGYGNLCKDLLQKLCAEIEEKNCRYDEAIKNLGFHHSKKEFGEIQGFLDYYGKAIPASTVPVKYGAQEEIDFGKIANPTVHVALNQVRKVVNSLIKENGNPEEIIVELARDLKISKDEKREMEKKQGDNQKENEALEKDLKSLSQKNSYENRLKLKLFRELERANNGVAFCPYSGKSINLTNLFSFDVEIEHILPFAKTYDDSVANKTIAYKSANHAKGNRSPFEAFGDATFERIKDLPRNKRWRFYENAMDKFSDENGFQERQLNDTRYLSKIAKQYLSQICHPNKIKVANGKLTSLLRHHWGMNSILNKKAEEKVDLETGEVFSGNITEIPQDQAKNKVVKKTRDDHRHHAVDAIVIAMTETRLLQQISRDNAKGHDLDRLVINLPSYWNRFREDAVEAIEKIVVSHKSDHGKNTQLHDETYYGILKEPYFLDDGKKSKEPYNLVASCSILTLKKSEAKFVRDAKLREELVRIANEASSDKEFRTKFLPEFSKRTGVKNVRFYDKNQSIIEISHPQKNPRFSKAIKTNGNHHISVWKMPDGAIKTDVVSNFKMNCPFEIKENELGQKFVNKQRKFLQNQDYEKLKPHPAAKLLIRLFKDDLVRLEENGTIKTARIAVIGSTNQCYYFDHKNSSSDVASKKSFCLNEKGLLTKKIRKIFVTESGKVFDSGPILKTTQEN